MVSDVARTLMTPLTTGIKNFQFKKFGRYSNKYVPKFPDSKKVFHYLILQDRELPVVNLLDS